MKLCFESSHGGWNITNIKPDPSVLGTFSQRRCPNIFSPDQVSTGVGVQRSLKILAQKKPCQGKHSEWFLRIIAQPLGNRGQDRKPGPRMSRWGQWGAWANSLIPAADKATATEGQETWDASTILDYTYCQEHIMPCAPRAALCPINNSWKPTAFPILQTGPDSNSSKNI